MAFRRHNRKNSMYLVVTLLVIIAAVGGMIAIGLTAKPPIQTMVHHEILDNHEHEEVTSAPPPVQSL